MKQPKEEKKNATVYSIPKQECITIFPPNWHYECLYSAARAPETPTMSVLKENVNTLT